MRATPRRRIHPMDWRLLAGGAALLVLSGCASEVDFNTLRRDQRMLYRRLADTRADVDRLTNEVSRLRAQVDDGHYRRPGSVSSLPPPTAEPMPSSPSSMDDSRL